MYPKHESRASYLRHRREGTHERHGQLYRGNGNPEHEKKKFEREYGKKKGDYVYGATVGKVYREKYGHSYSGGRYPEGAKGHEIAGQHHGMHHSCHPGCGHR